MPTISVSRRAALTTAAFALLLCAALVWAASAAQAQQILQNFTGSNISNAGGYIPPDTQGAAGLGSYVEMANNRYAVYSKNGGATQQASSLDSFWTSAFSGTSFTRTGASFDPRVVYDPVAQRFYAAALDFGTTSAIGNHQDNHILLAVSNSSDPTAGWKGIAIAASQGTDHYFADYPTLGFNADGVYVSVNNFPTTDPLGEDPDENLPVLDPTQIELANATGYTVSVLAAPKASLLAQTTAGSTFFYGQGSGSLGFVAHPVIDQDNASGTEYIFSDYNTASGSNKISRVTGTAATPTLSTANGFVTVTAYSAPPQGKQPNADNSLDTGDTRFGSSVVKVNGQLWAVQNVTLNGRAGLKWVRVDAATMTLIAEGVIGDAGHDYFYGSIAVNGQGTVVIAYSRSGTAAGEFVGSYASVGSYGPSGATFQSPLLLQAGNGNYDLKYGGTRNRWGDYSSTVVDPTDPTRFWTSQEWASATNTWSTQITELVVPAPEPSPMAIMGMGALSLVLMRVFGTRERRQPECYGKITS